MNCSNLIGNTRTQQILQHMLDTKRVPNTLLFHGPNGVGKKQFALRFAAALMGAPHRHKVLSGTHPDIHTYHPEGKSGMHPIAAMHQLIQEIALPPFEAPVKVFIIDETERMLPSSSNALLKTLEEPPPDTILILLTSQPEQLLPTIISRCRKVPFFTLSAEEISHYLNQNFQKTPQEMRRIAFLAQGSIAKAHQLASHDQDPIRDCVLDILKTTDYPIRLKHFARLEELCWDEEEEWKGKRHIDTAFEEILCWYRDAELLSHGCSSEYLFHIDQLPALKEMAPVPLDKVFHLISECKSAIERNIKLRSVLEYFFVSL